jgi:hypothetical protein
MSSIDHRAVRARIVEHLTAVSEAMRDARPELIGIARALDGDPDCGTMARTARLAGRWIDGQARMLDRLLARAAHDDEPMPDQGNLSRVVATPGIRDQAGRLEGLLAEL